MIPLKDNIASRIFPIVNLSLIAVNIFLFLFELALGPHLGLFLYRFGAVPARFFSMTPLNPLAYLPLLSSIFLHGGFLHLFGNMLFLWIFGDNVEDHMGHLRYFFFYIACGLLASLTQIILYPSSSVPSIGASGAIAGVMGAYIFLFPNARVLTLIPIFFFIEFIEIPAFFFIGIWFLMQFFTGVASLGASLYQHGGVAWWAHIGGFIFGIALLPLFKRRNYSPPLTIYRRI